MTQEEKQCRCYNTIKGMGHDPICDCECHQPKTQEDWENEIHRLLQWPDEEKNIKSFIKDLLEKREEELVERIKSKEIGDIPHSHLFYGDTNYPADAVTHGYNEALNDIISIIEDK